MSRYYESKVDQKGDQSPLTVTRVTVEPSDSTDNSKHIYVNISTQNVSTTTGTPATFQMDFDQPYLKNSEKYYLTIAKASFPTTSIPLFNFKLGTANTVSGATPYSVNMRQIGLLGGVTAYLRPINIPNNGRINLVTGESQYDVFYYQQFLDSLNMALLECFNALIVNTAFPAFTGIAPFVVFDSQSNGFNLITQKGKFTPELPSVEGGVTISFSNQLFRLFNSFPSRPTPTITPSALDGYVDLLIEERSGDKVTSGAESVNPELFNTMANVIGGLDTQWQPNFNYNPGSIVQFGGNYYGCAVVHSFGTSPPAAPWHLIGSAAAPTRATIWDVTSSYVAGNIVYYPTANSVPYVNLVNFNAGLIPPANPAQWRSLAGTGYPTIWNNTTAYSIGQNVIYPSAGSSGTVYTALTAGAGNNPGNIATIGVNWTPNSVLQSNIINGAYNTIALWSDVESIVIETGSLPIRYEVYAPPNSDVTAGGSQVPRPILTDLDLIKQISGFDRTPVQYVPPGNYRMVDLLAKAELKRIDSFIQYKTKSLQFKDLILLPGDYFSIKFLFVRNDAFSLA